MMIKKIVYCLALSLISGVSVAAQDTNSLLLNQASSAQPSELDKTKEAPNQQLQEDTYQTQSRSGMLLPGETDVRQLLPTSEANVPPPYGANLFAGGMRLSVATV